ncbi:MAG: hypothetical protein KDJ47_11720 [Hyphomicrobiaceae bacterium]|nr:hypothetical protein [Hyphomicrobiaceae bacterium]
MRLHSLWHKALAMLLATVLAGPASARADELMFSADALEQNPSGVKRHGRLFVRGEDTRYEYTVGGEPVIEIELPDKGLRFLLLPGRQIYSEEQRPPRIQNADENPCLTTAQQICTRVDAEQVGGIDATVFAVSQPGLGETQRIWWDSARRLVVREEFPSGQRMHAVKRQGHTHEGLQTELWEFTYLFPGGRYAGGMALYAPRLRLPVVERRADGLIRRLVNIQIGQFPSTLFQIPEGYAPMRDAPADQALIAAPATGQPANWPAPDHGMGPVAEGAMFKSYPQMLQGGAASR